VRLSQAVARAGTVLRDVLARVVDGLRATKPQDQSSARWRVAL
jgi:hypothetical protein